MASCTTRIIVEVESLLLQGQQLMDDESSSLKHSLGLMMKGDDLRSLLKCLGVRLTGAVRKGDIAERLLGMARIGAINKEASSDNDTTSVSILYLTDEVRRILSELPPFSSITQWSKNLLLYLVYGHDKTFDMDSLKAFKSLKTYK